jgi:hypothetical protein
MVSLILVVQLELQIFSRIFRQNLNWPQCFNQAPWVKLFMKKLKRKFLWYCPYEFLNLQMVDNSIESLISIYV